MIVHCWKQHRRCKCNSTTGHHVNTFQRPASPRDRRGTTTTHYAPTTGLPRGDRIRYSPTQATRHSITCAAPPLHIRTVPHHCPAPPPRCSSTPSSLAPCSPYRLPTTSPAHSTLRPIFPSSSSTVHAAAHTCCLPPPPPAASVPGRSPANAAAAHTCCLTPPPRAASTSAWRPPPRSWTRGPARGRPAAAPGGTGSARPACRAWWWRPS